MQPGGVLQPEPLAEQFLGVRQPARQRGALGIVREELGQLRALTQQPLPLRTQQLLARSGVRSAAGASKSRSSTACTMVPRVAAALGGSGSLSITRSR